MSVEIVPARLTHVGPLAANMRDMDREECLTLGRSPKEALRGGLRCSLSAFTALEGQSPIAMFGVVPEAILGGVGRVWLLGTDRVLDHPRDLLVIGRAMIADWLKTFERLENAVTAENEPAIRMLRHWGFSLDDEPFAHGGAGWLRFWRERAAIQAPRMAA